MIGLGPSITRGQAPWTPSHLFASGEQGAWYDPSDLSTLFQDSAGATPLTATGQISRKVLDRSGRGNHLTGTTGAVLQQDANGHYYLQGDGVSSLLASAPFATTDGAGAFTSLIVAQMTALPAATASLLATDTSGGTRVAQNIRVESTGQVDAIQLSTVPTAYNALAGSIAIGTAFVASSRSTGSSLIARVHGLDGSPVSVTNPQTAPTALSLFGRSVGGQFANCRILAALHVARLVTAAELSAAERYLAARCGASL